MIKIHEINSLAEILKREKGYGKKVVLCHGVFDLLHIGHIRYLEQAASMGDILVVTVTPDAYVDKGPHRPAFPEQLRAEAIASLGCVDFVAVNAWETAEKTLEHLCPDYYVKGTEFKNPEDDPTGKMGREAETAKRLGVRLMFAGDIVFSSSNLINRYLSVFSREIEDYLQLFRKRHSPEEVLSWVENMKRLKVLVVGDTIIDEYHYCEPMGISSKDPVLAVKYQDHESFAGGALAISNHLAGFSSNVTLLTVLGDDKEAFVRSNLDSLVNPEFFYHRGAPTTVKRRFVDGYSLNKLFEVYEMDDSGQDPVERERISKRFREIAGEHDLVIAADFGHGAIDVGLCEELCREPGYLAVMVQANSGNRGFNTVKKYRRADLVCIAEHEMRLEMRDRSGSLGSMMSKLIEDMDCRHVVVTQGKKGARVVSSGEGHVAVPSFTTKTVDRVGAGDAFLCLASLAGALGAPGEIIGFLGNVAGSLAVNVVGNKKPVKGSGACKFITSIMK